MINYSARIEIERVSEENGAVATCHEAIDCLTPQRAQRCACEFTWFECWVWALRVTVNTEHARCENALTQCVLIAQCNRLKTEGYSPFVCVCGSSEVPSRAPVSYANKVFKIYYWNYLLKRKTTNDHTLARTQNDFSLCNDADTSMHRSREMHGAIENGARSYTMREIQPVDSKRWLGAGCRAHHAVVMWFNA